jgi:glycosyltransferase involved in cell wall biosynthesis
MNAARPSVLLMGDTLNLGGTEGQFVEVARGLDGSRWDVDVACIRAEGPLRARLEGAGIRPWSCGRGSFKSPRFVGAVVGLVRHLRSRRVQIVHCFDFYSNILGVTAARLARVPVIIASQRDLGNLRPRSQQRLHEAMLRLATHVLVNSEAIAERLASSHAARAGRLSVIRNGVDLSRFAPPQAVPSRSRTLIVGVLANLRPEKGLHQLVEAAALVIREAPGTRFSIWGEGSLRPEIESKIRALGLTETVRLHGSTAEPESALRQCDVFVLPSLSEACSNVVLEAMATGLPVVATRVGGTPALIEADRSGLLVPPGDPAALAQAILKLIRAPSLAAELGAAARAHALAEFAMSRMLDRIEALYHAGLEPQSRTPVRAGVAS